MRKIIESTLNALDAAGNIRRLPNQLVDKRTVDLSSNDYLGLASDKDLQLGFEESGIWRSSSMSASASRLLAHRQSEFVSLENKLAQAYGRTALLFNSGYHANTGMVSALGAMPGAYILADKLVHASIIDGIKLSGAPFARFRHNDYGHLERLASKVARDYPYIIIIAESIYSMDGDRADIEALVSVKRKFPESVLYIDEAHAVGVEGPAGLGLAKASPSFSDIDIVVGTFGKALASTGAFAILDTYMRDFMVNKARSLIFSTAIPPINAAWTEYVFTRALEMDDRRERLRKLSARLAQIIPSSDCSQKPSHIRPLLVGDPKQAVNLSQKLAAEGFDVLPIRTPTVPPGTDRLRFSLSASLGEHELDRLSHSLKRIL